tara:strand:- start:5055 stop:5585 length:531 start_codon:yes stop_codon:yes gene_type:complete
MKIQPVEPRWLKEYCSLELIDGVIVKTFNKNFPNHLDDRWQMHYDALRKINPMPVEIYEIKDNKIFMEYIPGNMTLVQWMYKNGTSHSRLAFISEAIHRLCADILRLSKDLDAVFYQEDLNLTNFMIHENKIRLVDPESFIFSKTINYMAMIQPHIHLSKVAHKIMEDTISNTKFY